MAISPTVHVTTTASATDERRSRFMSTPPGVCSMLSGLGRTRRPSPDDKSLLGDDGEEHERPVEVRPHDWWGIDDRADADSRAHWVKRGELERRVERDLAGCPVVDRAQPGDLDRNRRPGSDEGTFEERAVDLASGRSC